LTTEPLAAACPWLAPYVGLHGIGPLIDHTLLKPEATESDVHRLCDEAMALGLGAVCVNGQWVESAVGRLRATGAVRVAAVVGFPLGASGTQAKVSETHALVDNGADEIDMVIALGWVKSGEWTAVRQEIAAVVEAGAGRMVKVILETAALSADEIERGSRAALEGGARMVKSSTGFHPAGGATVEAIQQMRRVVGDRAGVKASGGIRSADDARRMLLAGADRIGSSSAASWGEALYRRLDENLAGHHPG
jgi:deoxyribose-phosphate aldolase